MPYKVKAAPVHLALPWSTGKDAYIIPGMIAFVLQLAVSLAQQDPVIQPLQQHQAAGRLDAMSACMQ